MGIIKQLLTYSVVIICSYVIVNYIIFPLYTRHGKEFDLADLSEISIKEAQKLLDKNEMELIISDSSHSSIVPRNHIIMQFPKAFSRVKLGRRVYVTVSLGIKPTIVPLLKGLSIKDARFKLLARGIEIKHLFRAYSGDYPKNVIMQQSKTAGRQISVGDSISITVSLGRNYESTSLKNYVETQYKWARKELQRFGLLVKRKKANKETGYISGTIVEQSISPGTLLKSQTEIIFWVVE